jgi:hypothetical protein
MLTSHSSAHYQKTTGSPQGILRQTIYIWYELHIANGEEGGIIEQGAVDTTLIRALDMYKLEVPGFQRLLITEIFQTFGILYL